MNDSLIANANNNYYKNAAVLTGARNKVKVLVEDEFDIPFWNNALKHYASGYEFSITPYSYENDENRISRLTKGKDGIIAKADDFGPNFIGCIDSDYEYIIRHHNKKAAKNHSHDFIIPTYSYAVENLLCDPKTLIDLCVTASCSTEINFGFEDFFNNLSVIVYPLIVWGSFLTSTDKTECFSQKSWSKILNKDLTLIHSTEKDILSNIQKRVDETISKLETEYLNILPDKLKFEDALRKSGELTEYLAWTYVRGHDLADFILHCILNPLVKKEKDKHISFISQRTDNRAEKGNAINHYKNICQEPIKLLGNNFSWYSTHPHSRLIESKIKAIFSNPKDKKGL